MGSIADSCAYKIQAHLGLGSAQYARDLFDYDNDHDVSNGFYWTRNSLLGRRISAANSKGRL
jgi:hypothetical protein